MFYSTPLPTCCKPSEYFSERWHSDSSVSEVNQKETNKEGNNLNMAFVATKSIVLGLETK